MVALVTAATKAAACGALVLAPVRLIMLGHGREVSSTGGGRHMGTNLCVLLRYVSAHIHRRAHTHTADTYIWLRKDWRATGTLVPYIRVRYIRVRADVRYVVEGCPSAEIVTSRATLWGSISGWSGVLKVCLWPCYCVWPYDSTLLLCMALRQALMS